MLKQLAFIALLLLYISGILCINNEITLDSSEDLQLTVEEAAALEVVNNLNEFSVDYVVMFYSSWCVHCHQFLAYFDMMAINTKEQGKDILFRKFNCEIDKVHEGNLFKSLY